LKHDQHVFGRYLCLVLAAVAGIATVLRAALPGLDFPLQFDESYNLALAKHLATTGQYATEIVGVPLRWFDPLVTTGPTVLAPIALIFKLFGVGIIQARIIPIIYFGLLIVSAYFAAKRQSTWRAGCIVVLLLFALTSHFDEYGIVVFGEIPAVAFLLLAAIALARDDAKGALVCGALVGAAILTKPQMVLVVPALGVAILAAGWHNLWSFLRRVAFGGAGIAVPLLLWMVYQLAVVGPAKWFEINRTFFSTLTRDDGFATQSGPMWLYSLLLLLPIAVLVAFRHSRQRGPIGLPISLDQRGFLIKILAVVVALAPIPLMHWDFFARRFYLSLHETPFQMLAILTGLVVGLALGLIKSKPSTVMLSLAGILFAFWYFGIDKIEPGHRYTIYWQVLGFVQCGVLLDLIVGWTANRLRSLLGLRDRPAITYRLGYAVFAACVLIGLLLSVRDARYQQTLRHVLAVNDGEADVVNWIMHNTPENAILLGRDWWLPWDVSVLSNRKIADVMLPSIRTTCEMDGPRFFVMRDEVTTPELWDPELARIVETPALRAYQAGELTVYRWLSPAELSGRPDEWNLGPELLRNPGFEVSGQDSPYRWGRGGEPKVDRSGNQSRNGRTAVLSDGPGNLFLQSVPVTPHSLYRLSLYA
jgi:4-amino-4-deoxy-L-arabinose transferase-like glycosyltransferase